MRPQMMKEVNKANYSQNLQILRMILKKLKTKNYSRDIQKPKKLKIKNSCKEASYDKSLENKSQLKLTNITHYIFKTFKN